MDVGIGEALHFLLGVIGQSQLLIQGLDIGVEEDSGDDCQGYVSLDVLVCLVIAVHANISEQVDVAE